MAKRRRGKYVNCLLEFVGRPCPVDWFPAGQREAHVKQEVRLDLASRVGAKAKSPKRKEMNAASLCWGALAREPRSATPRTWLDSPWLVFRQVIVFYLK